MKFLEIRAVHTIHKVEAELTDLFTPKFMILAHQSIYFGGPRIGVLIPTDFAKRAGSFVGMKPIVSNHVRLAHETRVIAIFL